MTNKISAEKRREEIKELITESGLVGLNKSALGRKFGVSDVTIGKDIKLIINELPKEEIESLINKLYVQFNHALVVAEKLLESEDESVKLKAIDTLISSIERYLNFLKNYAKEPEFLRFLMNNSFL